MTNVDTSKLSPASQQAMQDFLEIPLPADGQISQDQAPEDNTPRWHEMRRAGFGGSDIMAMFGLSKYCTPQKLWKLKTGDIEPDPPSKAAARGTMMEPHVIRRAEQALNIEVLPGMKFFRHPEWNLGVRIQANTDGLVKGRQSIFEAKTCAAGGLVSVDYQEGVIPVSHMLQLHAYMLCLNMDKSIIACVEGPKDAKEWTPDVGRIHVLEVKFCTNLKAPVENLAKRFWQAVEERQAPTYKRHAWANDVLKMCALHHAQGGVKRLH